MNNLRLLVAPLPLLLFVLASAQGAVAPEIASSPQADFQPLEPVNLAKLSPADFSDEDLDLPYYLYHFHTVANAVEFSGPNRGFIHINVWRKSEQPYNLRIMENILSLAWFYCADRAWNPYRGDRSLRARLEAALEFWCSKQFPDGHFYEGPGEGTLAPTAFAAKFVGEALVLLRNGPPLDPALLDRAEKATRRAIVAVLTQPYMYSHGRSYTNQFTSVYAGALEYFEVHPDPELRALWEQVYRQSDDFHSPAGYYYEANGCDFTYTLDTTNHNTRQVWPVIRGTPLGDKLVSWEAAWYDWLSYNALPEPDGSGYVLNRAVETRQRQSAFVTFETPVGEVVPLGRAFSESFEEREVRYRRERAALAADWPAVEPMELGKMTTFSPYVFIHRRLHEWIPTTALRDAARALLPINARPHFTQQRRDSRANVVYTFAHRPGYYAAFTAGEPTSPLQRFGLGLLWTPALGAVLQSQSASDTAAWGFRGAATGPVGETKGIKASYGLNQTALPYPAVGIHDLPKGDVSVRYPAGAGTEKTVTFAENSVRVAIHGPGEITEILPILVPPDGQLATGPGGVNLETPRGNFHVSFGATVGATLAETSLPVLKKHVVVVTLKARDDLSYALETSK